MSYQNLVVEAADGIVTVTVNRPKALNALDATTIEELGRAVDAAAADPGTRALILTGAGDKAFVAGADIAAMARMDAEAAGLFAARAHWVFAALEALPVPTIAAVNGFALGGGCELTLACDLVYASERARFGQPEVNLGLVPGFGGTQRLWRRVGPMRAAEMILTADHYDAAAAREMGLALEVVAPEKLLEHARGKARTIASRGPRAVALAKRLMRAGQDLTLAAGCEAERRAFGDLLGGGEAREGMAAFLEKRPARFPGR
jgi:enoyl-CoA hydratase